MPRRPLRLGRDAPSKLAARRISEDEVLALLEDHVVADDELDDATVLISVYEPDVGHGWTTDTIDRTLRGDGPRE